MESNGLRIVSLTAENVKRLRAVHIAPAGSLVVVSGENGVGKSSVLDAIEMALRGKVAVPAEPIRRGAHKARIVLDLGDIVVERSFAQGSSKLTVKAKDGEVQKSPQALLDELVSRISFDPLEFATMAPKEQDRVLRELVGLDTSEQDTERARLYAERTAANRDVGRLRAQLDAMPPRVAGVPAEEVSAAELVAELQRRQAIIEETAQVRRALESIEADIARNEAAQEASRRRIADLEREIGTERGRLAEIEKGRETLREEHGAVYAELDERPNPNLDEIREQLAHVEQTNRAIRSNRDCARLQQELDATDERTVALSDAIDAIDAAKAQALAAAQYPIPGLGLDDTGVILDGLPFEQASTSAKIRASIAIGAALNPRLRVLLVRRGNDLDRERMGLVAEMARELDLQVWVERIEAGGMPAVVIEDGEVVAEVAGAGAELGAPS